MESRSDPYSKNQEIMHKLANIKPIDQSDGPQKPSQSQMHQNGNDTNKPAKYKNDNWHAIDINKYLNQYPHLKNIANSDSKSYSSEQTEIKNDDQTKVLESNLEDKSNVQTENKIIEHEIAVTLEEIYRGCLKKEMVKLDSGKEELFTIKIKPGIESGTRIGFTKDGSLITDPKVDPEIIFIIKEQPHKRFKRVNQVDLEYIVELNDENVKKSGPLELEIPTLENDPIFLSFDDDDTEAMIREGTIERITGRGLPFVGDKKKRGDLIVKFGILDNSEPESEPKSESKIEKTHEFKSEPIPEPIISPQPQPKPRNSIKRLNTNQTLSANDPNHYDLFLSQEEMRRGCIKNVPIKRKVLDKFGIESIDEKFLIVKIKPESEEGTQVRIPEEGDSKPGKPNADVIFTIREKVGIKKPIPISQDQPVEHELFLTLEQIYHGCTKRMKIHRKILDPKGQENEETKILTIKIKPGTLTETKFTFSQEGDNLNPETIPADIIFTLHEKPHEIFRRNGADLEHEYKITQAQFSNNEIVRIPTLLEGEIIQFSLRKLTKIDAPKRFHGQGLPFEDNPDKRGDLIVHFRIVADSEEHDQDFPIVHQLFLSFEEILRGCTKKIKINRKVVEYGEEMLKDQIVSLKIPAGTKPGSKFTFQKLGDETLGKSPADIIFITTDKEHSIYKRIDATSNLEYLAKITSSEAKSGNCKIEIPTLEKAFETLNIDESILDTEKDVARIVGKGLPLEDINPEARGDLIVKFEIVEDDFKDPPIEKYLELTLEEILSGCTKNVKIVRKIFDSKEKEKVEEKLISIDIKPGTEPGTRFIFYRSGDQSTDKTRIPSDMIYITKDVPHSVFVKNGVDIMCQAKINEIQALNGCEVKIPTLEGEDLNLKLEGGVIQQNSIEKIVGRGLPYNFNPNERGNLVVKFEVEKCLNDKKNLHDSEDQKSKSELEIDSNSKTESKPEHKFESKSEPKTEFKQEQAFVANFELKPELKLETKHEPKSQFKFEKSKPESKSDLKSKSKPEPKFIHKPEPEFEPKPDSKSEPKNELKTASTSSNNKSFLINEENNIPMRFDLPLTLEKILQGSSEIVTFKRSVTNPNGYQAIETKTATIEVKPGTVSGIEFLLPREGNRIPGKIPVDVMFTSIDVPHPYFTRNGADLIYKAKLTLAQVQIGSQIQIQTLENKVINFKIASAIKSGHEIPFTGLGLPLPNENSHSRGKLIVQFEITENAFNEPKNEIIQQLPAHDIDLPLTLDEIVNGCIKEPKISVKIVDLNGLESEITKTFPIDIKPGTKTYSQFRFPQAGDQAVGMLPSDVIFTTIDEPHSIFTKVGLADLHQTVRITKQQAIRGSFKLKIPTLSNGKLPVLIDKRLTHGSKWELVGYGLPFVDEETGEEKLGNMILNFVIVREEMLN